MRIFLLLVVFFYCFSIPAAAQKEATYWYFGDRAGINFKTGTARADTNGQINTSEGCASISDSKTGDLLFYTDGVSVWNYKHELMTGGTGLAGGYSSTQSALIVPVPEADKKYYIFTSPDLTNNKPITTTSTQFSIVSLKNPGGEVTSLNETLISGTSEKLAGTIDCSGKGYWVLTHLRYSNDFYAFHVTKSGVEPPVISHYDAPSTDHVGGYMKISPNGKKVAIASVMGKSFLALFDFDTKTGKVSNSMLLGDTINKNRKYYGLTFSPDNSKLYAADLNGGLNSFMQYETDVQDVYSSGTSIKSGNGMIAMQIGPDGKIYASFGLSNSLSVIDYPNLKGDSCSLRRNVVPFRGLLYYGLPNFMDYIFNKEGIPALVKCTAPNVVTQPDSGCIASTLVFTDKSIDGIRRVWSFPNGYPTTSTDSIVSVTYSKAGTYKVILTVENDNGSASDTTYAIVYPNPAANAGTDKTICPNSSAQLGDKPEPGNKYSWLPTTDLDNPSIANPNASPKTTTQYILTVTSEHGCIAYDTVLVTVGNIVAKVSNDTTICSGSSVQLIASGGAKYTWSPSTGLSDTTIENPIATLTKTTTFKVKVSSGTCEDSAFVTITVNPQPTAKAGQDKTLCIGASTEIGEAAQTGFLYNWQPTNGLDDATKANPTASPTNTTQYILTVTGNGGCTASDTVLVTIGTIKAIVSNDTSICEGASAKLFASGGAKYEWSPSAGLDDSKIATPTANPTITTRYKVFVSSGTCIDSAFVTVTILPPPNANAGEDKPICIGESTQIGIPTEAGNSYLWSPSTGLSSPTASQTTASPATTTTYTLTVTNPAGCVKSDKVVVTVNPRNERSFTLQPDMVTILPGKQFTTNLEIPSGVNDWSVTLKYDSLLVKFNSISGAQAIPDDRTGELLVNGNGGSRSVPIIFDAFLPHTSDTIYPVTLTVDASKVADCETWNAVGNILMLADYCGKNIRVVSSTGKRYFLTVKDKSIDFGVGLSGNVHLEVFDYVGNSVLVVSDGALAAGEYSAALDLPVGVYYCRLRAGLYEQVGKVLIAR